MDVELRDQIDPRSAETAEPQLPLLRRAAAPHLRRPRHVAAVRELRAAGPARGDGALLSAARPDLRALPAGAARGARRAGGDLHGVRVLLLLLGLLGRARARLRGVRGRALRARLGQPGGGARQQRRLPAPARRRAGNPRARRRAGRERRRRRRGSGGSRPWSRSSVGTRPTASPPRAAGRTCSSPTTSSRTSPT